MLVNGKITKIIKKYITENLIKEKKSNPRRDKIKERGREQLEEGREWI